MTQNNGKVLSGYSLKIKLDKAGYGKPDDVKL